jgi:cysteine desulfurase/selenocysteine lyase
VTNNEQQTPMPTHDSLEKMIAYEFPVEGELRYLNHAAVAPLPRRSGNALQAFIDDYVRVGSLNYLQWLETERHLRDELRMLINAQSSDDIALLKNTSEGLSFVAWGFPWRQGDNVVIPDEEFPSNRIVWESLAPRGVVVRTVSLAGAADPVQALLAACDGRTRLLSVSAVQYASGRRVDLARLGEACRKRDIAFCVDAIQGLGMLDLDVQAIGADFMAADAHKWLLGPEGIALFYCRADWRDRLDLVEFGWHMVEHMGEFDRGDWEPARSARRFECGTPNTLGIYAFSASLSLLLEIGMGEIEQRVLARATYLMEAIQRRDDLECLTPDRPGSYGGIVTFRSHRYGNEALFEHLKAQRVMCAMRGGGIRFSPHFYNAVDTLDAALAETISI